MSNQSRTEKYVALSVSLSAFVLYAATANRSIDFIDSGELATVCHTLGIAHPTGYPVFTLVGWLFSHLPLGLRTIHQLNLMSSFFCAAGLFFFFRSFILIGSLFMPAPMKDSGGKNPMAIYLPASVSASILGFSVTYWSQSTSIEVYSLHLFFLSLLIFFFLRSVFALRGEGDGGRELVLFAYLLGLSFANHLTTILLAPAMIVFFFVRFHAGRRAWKRIAILALPFLAGFSTYLYLPVRALSHPLMNWGNPADFERWFWHFSGKVYRVWIFSSTESAGRQLNYFARNLPGEFGYYPLILGLFGAALLFRKHRKLFYFSLLLFATTVFYSINYDIHDIDSYFLLAYAAFSVWICAGTAWLIHLGLRKVSPRLVLAVALVAGLSVIKINYDKVDEHDETVVESYARGMLASFEKDAVVISFQWDYFISAAYYLQAVEGERPDVVVIDKELLRRSWYYSQLADRYPGLFSSLKTELSGILGELNKFEKGLRYDPGTIEFNYRRIIRGIIEKNIQTRPVYVTPEIEDEYISGYHKVPSGLAFRLMSSPYAGPLREMTFGIPDIRRDDIYGKGIKGMYARSYFNYGLYYRSVGDTPRSEKYIGTALSLDPSLLRLRR